MATRDINTIDLMRGINAVNGDGLKLDEVITNIATAKNEEWFKQSKSFLNIDNMPDEDLSKNEPLMILGLEQISQSRFQDSQKTQIADRTHSEYPPIRVGTITSNVFNTLAELTTNSPFEIKPRFGIGNFERVCFVCSIPTAIRTYSDTSYVGNPVYSASNFTGAIKCKKIDNGVISDVELNCFIGNIDFASQSNLLINFSSSYNPVSINLLLCFFFFNEVTNVLGANSTNAWIFKNDTDANAYLNNGTYTNAINYHSDYEPPVIVDDGSDGLMYYWRQHAYTKNNSKGAKNYINDLSFEIEIDLSNTASRTLAMQREFSGSNTGDCELKINNSDDILEVRYRSWNSEEWEVHPISFLYNLDYIYRNLRNMTSGTYKNKILASDLTTNIPVFYRDGETDKYFDEEIDIDSAVNSEDLHYFDEINHNGDGDKEKSELNEINTANNLSEILELTTGFMSQFSTFLSNSNEMDNIINGLKLRGGNPISFIVDLFALPFKIDSFVVKQSETDMFFGTYQHTFSSAFYKIVRTNILKNVFSTFIMPIFNDWRDYLTNVYIYLPYVNIQPLKYEEIVNKTLSCKVGVDVTTGTIKYFIFANGVMIQTFEGSVRQNAPISATDYYGSSMTKIDGASQIVQGVAQGITGNPQGLISFAKGGGNLLKQPPKSITGNYSSSTAFFDELNAYLIYEQTNVLYPQTIISKYNLPNNMVGKLSACSGYTEIDDIDLNINCEENIRENIVSILKSGFYID